MLYAPKLNVWCAYVAVFYLYIFEACWLLPAAPRWVGAADGATRSRTVSAQSGLPQLLLTPG